MSQESITLKEVRAILQDDPQATAVFDRWMTYWFMDNPTEHVKHATAILNNQAPVYPLFMVMEFKKAWDQTGKPPK